MSITNKPTKSNPPFYYYSGKGWKIDTKIKIDGEFKKLSKCWYQSLQEAKRDYPVQVNLLQERIAGSKNAMANKECTWADFEDEFLAYRKTQVRGSSICMDRRRLANYIVKVKGKDKASTVFTAQYARDLQKRIMASDLTRLTKNKILGFYLQMLDYAFEHEFLSEDGDYRRCKAEIHRIKAIEQEDNPMQKVALTDKECTALLNVIDDPRDKMLVMTLLETGVRIGEALALRPMDFDFHDDILRITRTVAIDENGVNHIYNRTKTRLGIRSIPLRHDYSLIVQAYASNFNITDSDLLFDKFGRCKVNAVVMDKTAFGRRLKQYCKEAHIPEVSPHCLRHTFATKLSLNCYSDADRQARAYIMGHSVTVDEEIYTAHNQLETAKGLIH